MKNAFTALELAIVLSIVGLLLAIAVPSFMKAKHQAEINAEIKNTIGITPSQTYMMEHQFQKKFEFNGYDIYTFWDGHMIGVAIPSTNSVPLPLEKKN